MQDVILYILLLEFVCRVMHELPISSHIILNIQFENCHSLTDVQWLVYVANTCLNQMIIIVVSL